MRLNTNNAELPGVQTERIEPIGQDVHTERVYIMGALAGSISYVRRSLKGGSEYGWRPARSHYNTALTTKTEAIKRLSTTVFDITSIS